MWEIDKKFDNFIDLVILTKPMPLIFLEVGLSDLGCQFQNTELMIINSLSKGTIRHLSR